MPEPLSQVNLGSVRLTTLTVHHTSLWLFVDCRQVQSVGERKLWHSQMET